LIQQIRQAREKVKGTSNTLDNVSKQLESLVRSLILVKEEEKLQTAGVTQQVMAVITIGEELKRFLGSLTAEQSRKPVSQFLRALRSGEGDDKQLEEILDRLDRARDELTLRILVAQVGVVGNVEDGFRVAFNVLLETNERVKEVLGVNLALVDRLKDRSPQQTGTRIAATYCKVEYMLIW
jgi:hypothetical protein